MKQLAIFASGTGSNARRLIEYFKHHSQVRISLIVSNKPGAGVLKIAEEHDLPTLIIEREIFFRGNAYVEELKERKIDFIILAGFLWKIPDALIAAFPNSIINIHPALLPAYGGKGMYGHHVHEAVIKNKEQQSGITIHYVDGHYDHGDIIFQATCEVMAGDDASTLASRVLQLEHMHFAPVVEKVVLGGK